MTERDDLVAYVGIDWADRQHAVCLHVAGSSRCETMLLEQSPEAIDSWATSLRERFGGQPVGVCLEQSKGALLWALLKYDFLVIYPINPKQLARYREAIAPSGAKDDPSDAELLAEFLAKHRQQLTAWQPDDEQTRLLRMLCEDRRALVDERTKLVNRLKSRLKQYFPQALNLLSDLRTDLACDFLSQWSSLEELQAAEPDEVRTMVRGYSSNHRKLLAGLETIAQQQPLVTDRAVVESCRMSVRALAAQMRTVLEAIRRFDGRIAELMQRHADAPIFRSFPGAGAALAPRLLAAFGSDRDRLSDARQMQELSGTAPVTRRSGRTQQVLRRWACNKFLKQTFHEFASISLQFSPWARAYYRLQRERGKRHHAAVRALAFKWIRILHRCWQDRTQYDELAYFQRLQANASPLLQHITKLPRLHESQHPHNP